LLHSTVRTYSYYELPLQDEKKPTQNDQNKLKKKKKSIAGSIPLCMFFFFEMHVVFCVVF